MSFYFSEQSTVSIHVFRFKKFLAKKRSFSRLFLSKTSLKPHLIFLLLPLQCYYFPYIKFQVHGRSLSSLFFHWLSYGFTTCLLILKIFSKKWSYSRPFFFKKVSKSSAQFFFTASPVLLLCVSQISRARYLIFVFFYFTEQSTVWLHAFRF